MDTSHFGLESDQTTAGIGRGRVDSITDDGTVVLTTDHGRLLPCDQLISGERPAALNPGDVVLVWHSGHMGERGVILGLVGVRSARHAELSASENGEAPESLVLEAKHFLTLRVGDGSITIREDGKILIKGKDLVSHAQRMNRIKGGAVSIN